MKQRKSGVEYLTIGENGQDHGAMSYCAAEIQKRYDLAGSIEDVRRIYCGLPHGSGIDYTWRIVQHVTNSRRYTCHNSYHAMDEYGGYCHVYDFNVTIEVLPDNTMDVGLVSLCGQYERVCCGYGLRDYLNDTIYEGISWYLWKEEN